MLLIYSQVSTGTLTPMAVELKQPVDDSTRGGRKENRLISPINIVSIDGGMHLYCVLLGGGACKTSGILLSVIAAGSNRMYRVRQAGCTQVD